MRMLAGETARKARAKMAKMAGLATAELPDEALGLNGATSLGDADIIIDAKILEDADADVEDDDLGDLSDGPSQGDLGAWAAAMASGQGGG
jgi:hypothetical protein